MGTLIALGGMRGITTLARCLDRVAGRRGLAAKINPFIYCRDICIVMLRTGRDIASAISSGFDVRAMMTASAI